MGPKTLIIITTLIFSGCASSVQKLPPESPDYIDTTPQQVTRSVNSLWADNPGLFADIKARNVNDLITIKVFENASASKKAATKSGRKSSIDAGIDDLFGLPLDLNRDNLYGKGHTFSPSVGASFEDDFAGKGETSRRGSLIATITARVVQVQENGNLVIESRKEITVNREKQVLVLSGIIRPEDIERDNTIHSSDVANAKMYFVGDGVIEEKQGQGWLMRFMDKVWPF